VKYKPGTRVKYNYDDGDLMWGTIISHEKMSKKKFVCEDDICIEWDNGQASTYDHDLIGTTIELASNSAEV